MLLWKAQNNKIFNETEQQNISFERVADDSNRWVRCTNIHIVLKNIVFVSNHFPASVVEAGTQKKHDLESEMNT